MRPLDTTRTSASGEVIGDNHISHRSDTRKFWKRIVTHAERHTCREMCRDIVLGGTDAEDVGAIGWNNASKHHSNCRYNNEYW